MTRAMTFVRKQFLGERFAEKQMMWIGVLALLVALGPAAGAADKAASPVAPAKDYEALKIVEMNKIASAIRLDNEDSGVKRSQEIALPAMAQLIKIMLEQPGGGLSRTDVLILTRFSVDLIELDRTGGIRKVLAGARDRRNKPALLSQPAVAEAFHECRSRDAGYVPEGQTPPPDQRGPEVSGQDFYRAIGFKIPVCAREVCELKNLIDDGASRPADK
jgi:hypothetical protein